MFPFSIRINIKTLTSILESADVLSLVCTYQIIESIILMLSAFSQIRVHSGEKAVFAVKAASLLPSGIFLAGIFFFETYLFNVVDRMGFLQLALLFSISMAGYLFLCGVSMRKLIPGWEWRMELKIVLSFFQIVVAMCLPLLLTGLKVQGTQLQVDAFGQVMITWGALLLIVLAGLCGLPRLHLKYIHRKLI